MTSDEARDIVLDRAFEAPDLDYLLERSQATDQGDNGGFRPYWVAAKLWATAGKYDKRLVKGEGAEFESIAVKVTSLLDLQRIEDIGVIVPEGYEATVDALASGAIPRTRSVGIDRSF